MKKLRIFLVRHGETHSNLKQLISGRSETSLSKNGSQQAHHLARRLSSESFDCVISSPLIRARQTAEILSRPHGHTLLIEDGFTERSFGSFEGRDVKTFLRSVEDHPGPIWTYRPKNGESLEDLENRVSNAFDDTIENINPNSGNILIVAHHSVNKMLLHLLLGRNKDEWKNQLQRNACLNIIEYSPNEITPVVLNCIEHLSSNSGA